MTCEWRRTAPPGRPRGAMLHAYNKQTGAQVGEVWMPAPQSGSPMTYAIDGKQYRYTGTIPWTMSP